MGARPATLLQGWTPATCTLRRGRQGGRASLCPSPRKQGPRGQRLRTADGSGAQGDTGAGLGRQVPPKGARRPLTASWPTGPSESACSPERPQLRFWKLPAPWPLTPMEPGQASLAAHRQSESQSRSGSLVSSGELANSAPRWPLSPLPRQAAFPGPASGWTLGSRHPLSRAGLRGGWLFS